jgi:hypothetical protein
MTEAELQQRFALVRHSFRYWLEYVGRDHGDVAAFLTLATFIINEPPLPVVVPVAGHLRFAAPMDN